MLFSSNAFLNSRKDQRICTRIAFARRPDDLKAFNRILRGIEVSVATLYAISNARLSPKLSQAVQPRRSLFAHATTASQQV